MTEAEQIAAYRAAAPSYLASDGWTLADWALYHSRRADRDKLDALCAAVDVPAEPRVYIGGSMEAENAQLLAAVRAAVGEPQ